MPRQWIVVASEDHVARGVAGGFVQAAHGKQAPVLRLKPGDRVFCYSAVLRFGGDERLQAFTAMGTIAESAPYQVETGDGFRPHRRDVAWKWYGRVPIRPLLDKLELTVGRQSWGLPLRRGLVPISSRDAALIALAVNLALARPYEARTPARAPASPPVIGNLLAAA